MFTKKRGAAFLSGLWLRGGSVAGSVARARAVKVSIMILTQGNWTAVSTDSSWTENVAVMKVMTTVVTLVEISNCKNFLTALLMLWAHIMAFTIVVTSAHLHHNTGMMALSNSLSDARKEGILDTGDGDERHILGQVLVRDLVLLIGLQIGGGP